MSARRRVIAGLVGALGMLSAPSRVFGAAPIGRRTLLDPKEPLAVSIAYVHDAKKVDVKQFPTYKRIQTCETCALIELGTAWQRGCSLVPGRLVMSTGWCKAWVARGR